MSTHRFVGAALVLVLSGCTRTVTVQTISEYGGTPIAGVKVQVDDGEWMATDAQGEVEIHGVGWPFVLRMHQVTSGTTSAMAYRLDDVWVLRSPEGDPVVVLVDGSWVARSSARITGSVSGGNGGTVSVYATARSHEPVPNTGVSTGSFTLDVQWEQPGPFSSVLRAVEQASPGSPSHYRSYSEVAVTLTDPGTGGALDGVAMTLQPVSEGMVGATVALPPELDKASLAVSSLLHFPEGGELWLGAEPMTAPFSVPFPQISGTESWLSVHAVGGPPAFASSVHQRKVTVPSSGVVLDMLAPAGLVEPDARASIAAGTTFRWTGGSSGEQAALTMICDWTDGAGAARSVNYRTLEADGAEASLPELPGLAIDPGAQCSWQVARYPQGYHLGATVAETPASEYRYSLSESREATFQ